MSAGLTTLDYGEIPSTFAGGRTGALDAGDLAAEAGYGRMLNGGLAAGGQVRYVRETLHDVSAKTWAADAGLLYQPFRLGAMSSVRMGLAARNVGPPAKFIDEKGRLPRTVQAGASVRPFFEGLTLCLDKMRRRESWRNSVDRTYGGGRCRADGRGHRRGVVARRSRRADLRAH